jgi:hypothetical protein
MDPQPQHGVLQPTGVISGDELSLPRPPTLEERIDLELAVLLGPARLNEKIEATDWLVALDHKDLVLAAIRKLYASPEQPGSVHPLTQPKIVHYLLRFVVNAGQDLIAFISAEACRSPSFSVREYALQQATQLVEGGRTGATDLVVEFLNDPDPSIRYSAGVSILGYLAQSRFVGNAPFIARYFIERFPTDIPSEQADRGSQATAAISAVVRHFGHESIAGTFATCVKERTGRFDAAWTHLLLSGDPEHQELVDAAFPDAACSGYLRISGPKAKSQAPKESSVPYQELHRFRVPALTLASEGGNFNGFYVAGRILGALRDRELPALLAARLGVDDSDDNFLNGAHHAAGDFPDSPELIEAAIRVLQGYPKSSLRSKITEAPSPWWSFGLWRPSPIHSKETVTEYRPFSAIQVSVALRVIDAQGDKASPLIVDALKGAMSVYNGCQRASIGLRLARWDPGAALAAHQSGHLNMSLLRSADKEVVMTFLKALPLKEELQWSIYLLSVEGPLMPIGKQRIAYRIHPDRGLKYRIMAFDILADELKQPSLNHDKVFELFRDLPTVEEQLRPALKRLSSALHPQCASRTELAEFCREQQIG